MDGVGVGDQKEEVTAGVGVKEDVLDAKLVPGDRLSD